MFFKKTIQEPTNRYLDRLFEIKSTLSRFNQKFDIFNRAMWDDKVNPKKFFISYDIANYAPKKAKGFDHWDYAFRNASWHLTDVVGEYKLESEGRVEGFTDYYSIQTQGPPSKAGLKSAADTTQRIKRAAQMFGAGSVGICKLDQRWIYSHHFNRKEGDSRPLDIPESYKYAIIMTIPMDYDLSKTFPAALSGAATGLGYGVGLLAANTMAQFITNLGYNALASLNDSALSIPMAIEAGLGEYGRHGLLITPDFGPNIRLVKVFTDLPLVPDQPIEFGVKQFCEVCNRCAQQCPVRAIPNGPPQDTPPNESSLKGIRKWTVNAEKCFKFWVGMNTDCAICIRVCPYNKDYSKWWNRLGILMANSPLRTFMLWLDDKLGFGKRLVPSEWWNHND
jgi:epoxyqueuosine reductase